MKRLHPAILGAALCAASGCSSSGTVGSPRQEDHSGTYTIALTYRENGCDFEDWEEDSTLDGVPLAIVQNESDLEATVEGITGGVVALIHGSNVYDGQLEGSSAELVIYGKYPAREGNCTYTLNNVIHAEFDGDFITGTMSFTPQTNGNSDCEAVECSSSAEFNGSRAPE